MPCVRIGEPFRAIAMLTLPNRIFWLASFPKSGNTWMRILISNMLSGARQPEDINRLSLQDGIASGVGLFEHQTLLDSGVLKDEEIERMRPAVHDSHAAERTAGLMLKVHDAYTRLSDGRPLLGQAARAALYIVRDPRDVAVSLSFHLGLSLDSAIDHLNRPDSVLERTNRQIRQRLQGWSGHVQSWLDQSDMPVHLIRYEDLHRDGVGVLRGALDFIGADYDPDAVPRAVRHANFSELQRQERERGFRERPKGLETFFRRGEIGGWRQHLAERQAAAIETTHAAMMARLGYEIAAGYQGIETTQR